MRVTMSTVWDRTSEVLAGRQTILVSIALATLWLPAIVQQVVSGALLGDAPTPGPGGVSGLIGLLTFVVAVIGLFGKLAIVAVASDPAANVGDAYRLALRRLPLLLGLAALIGLAFGVLAIPLIVIGAPFAQHLATSTSTDMATPINLIPVGQRAFFGLYFLVLMIALLWVVVRLLTLNPVVLNERDGIGSYRRSFQITRGHFWRLLGVIVLFGIVITVAAFAAQSVIGIVARLILGPEHRLLAAFIATLFTAAIGAASNVVILVFMTRFYLLRREVLALP